ncbi:MAG: hypothetical protein ACK4ND_14315 [Cytophagaceae bacterium]
MSRSVLFTFCILSLFLANCNRTDVTPDERNKFTGRYDVDEANYTLETSSVYRIEVRKNDEIHDEILIDNFFNTGVSVAAVVTGSRIIIPIQQISYYEIEGTGVLNGTELRITYYVSNSLNSVVETLNAICTRR